MASKFFKILVMIIIVSSLSCLVFFFQQQSSDKVITQIKNIDINGDKKLDTIKLLLSKEKKVVLQVNRSVGDVFSVTNEKQIFGDDYRDKFTCELHVTNNTVFVGYTYFFTNKYGSTAEIKCYQYESNTLRLVKSFPSVSEELELLSSNQTRENEIEIKTDLGTRKIVLSAEETKDYLEYTDKLKQTGLQPEFMCTAMPEYKVKNNKSYIEFVTRRIVTCGPCPLSPVYFQKYIIQNGQVKKVDCWFDSEKPLLAKEYGFE